MNVSMLRVRTIASSSRQHSRSGPSSSSDSSRSAARRAAVPSSTPRSSIASSMSVRVNSRTPNPPPGSVSRRPFVLERHEGDRSGVRDTPSSSTRRSSATRSRGLKAPLSRSSRSPSVAFVVCEFAWFPRGTVVASYSRDGWRSGCERRRGPPRRSYRATMACTTPCLKPRKIAITKTPYRTSRNSRLAVSLLVQDREDGRADHRAEQACRGRQTRPSRERARRHGRSCTSSG